MYSYESWFLNGIFKVKHMVPPIKRFENSEIYIWIKVIVEAEKFPVQTRFFFLYLTIELMKYTSHGKIVSKLN